MIEHAEKHCRWVVAKRSEPIALRRAEQRELVSVQVNVEVSQRLRGLDDLGHVQASVEVGHGLVPPHV